MPIQDAAPKDFTAQENVVASCLDSYGLRYERQYQIGSYTVDFFVVDGGWNAVIEADGPYGHRRKKDRGRDAFLLDNGVSEILHIKSTTRTDIEAELKGFIGD